MRVLAGPFFVVLLPVILIPVFPARCGEALQCIYHGEKGGCPVQPPAAKKNVETDILFIIPISKRYLKVSQNEPAWVALH
jgi:hypothetical protein